MPWGTKQPTKRGFGLAAVCARRSRPEITLQARQRRAARRRAEIVRGEYDAVVMNI